MRWDDERYVRVYVRDTANWLKWPWQARALLPLLLRKVDRAGLLKLSRSDVVGDLAAVVGLPQDVVTVGLMALCRAADADERPTVEISKDGLLLVPNHMDAQEAGTSNRLRQEDCRRRARDVAAKPAKLLMPMSQPVTAGHGESQDVTVGHSVPSLPFRSVPSVPSQICSPDAAPDGALPLLSEHVNPAPRFDLLAIYRDYPKHEGKTKGLAKLQKQIRTPGDYEALKRALATYRTSKTVADGFVKNFDTWAGCWRDYLEAPHAAPERTYNGRG